MNGNLKEVEGDGERAEIGEGLVGVKLDETNKEGDAGDENVLPY